LIMAFDETALSCVGYGAGQTLYLYATTDPVASMVEEGYFNDADEQLRATDVILCACDTDGTPAAEMLIVQETGTDVVTVTALQ